MYNNDIYGEAEKGKNSQKYVLDYKVGDVTGDGKPEEVLLVGNKPYGEESPFTDNIELVVRDGETKQYAKIKLKVNSGYNPTLFLGDFTGDSVEEILVSIDSGGSGAIGYYYVYSWLNNKPRKIFDYEEFNEEYEYEVKYRNNYAVKVISEELKEKYFIDIRTRGEEYLSEIYYKDGKLKEPIKGFVNPISGLYPIDIQRDGIYGLYILQKIAGRYNADSLGYVQTYMEWKKSKFVPYLQQVSIYGADIKKEK